MSKDIKTIISYLDNYLTQTGQISIDAVSANAILSKAGLLTDSKDRPGKPLRNLLRDGKLPHAFQSGGKGSSWTIPHTNKQAFKIDKETNIAIKIKTLPRTSKPTKNLAADTSQIEEMLMDEKNFKSASSIDNLVPPDSGLYCIRIYDVNKLPNPFNTFLANRQHNIIYIGVATKSLNRRFLNQELRANGHGTFFRSLGALLGHRPSKGSLTSKINKRNYKFPPNDEQKIIKWINEHLQVNWICFNGDFENLEAELITKYRPLINIAKNPSALKELTDLRRLCVQIANQY